MNRQGYLNVVYERLTELYQDQQFIREMAQVRAKALQEILEGEPPDVGYTFDPKSIWNRCSYVLTEGSLLIQENFEAIRSNNEWFRRAAETLEFLAAFYEGIDRDYLIFSAALGYQIAGFQANAHCLIKNVDSGVNKLDHQNNVDFVLVSLFQSVLIQFLRANIKQLRVTVADNKERIQNLQQPIIESYASGDLAIDSFFELTGHMYFQSAFDSLINYCLFGEESSFETALGDLQKCYRYFFDLREVSLSSIISELHAILLKFHQRSTWNNIRQHAGELLENSIWNYYLKFLANDKSIIELWASQLKAIRENVLTSDDSFVIQMPTSAGKTLIGELAILSALTSYEGSKCLYIAPYRALVSEIETTLSESIGVLGYRVSNLLGGFEFDVFQDYLVRESDVIVATPEKIELFLRTSPDFFENVRVVVVDEGHIIDEGLTYNENEEDDTNILSLQNGLGRGAILELMTHRIKHKYPTARFIYLSAVMPDINAVDLVNWLSKESGDVINITPNERPSRQVFGKFEWKGQSNGELEFISLPEVSPNRKPFVPYFIQRQQYFTGELTPTGQRQRRSWPNITNKAQTVATLAVKFSNSGPVLVFCATRSDTRTVTENIITTIEYFWASDIPINDGLTYNENPDLPSFEIANKWLGSTHLLTRSLRYGIAFHYGPLPDTVRKAVEEDFRSEKIQILVSTSTLGQGVNLPIKTAIIYSVEWTWPETDPETGDSILKVDRVSKRDFWNICGRAGRAGKETEGQIVFTVTSDHDRELLNEYQNPSDLDNVESVLFKLLRLLIEKRISQDQLIGLLDSHILALLGEEIIDTDDEDLINDYLGTSLVGVQAIRNDLDLSPLVTGIIHSAKWISEEVPSRDLIQTYSSTGFCVESCKVIESQVEEFYISIDGKIDEDEYKSIICNLGLLDSILVVTSNVQELQLRNNIQYFGPENEKDLIHAWVNIAALQNLRTDFWVVGEEESFSEYLADRVIYKLPWGANGYLRLLASRLELNHSDLPVSWQSIPSMLKFGLNNVYACWAASLGAPTREISQQVATHYEVENGNLSYQKFVKWFATLPSEYIINEIEGSHYEIQNLIKNIQFITPSDTVGNYLGNPEGGMVSPVKGIPYEGREQYAALVKDGDPVELILEPENVYDPFAVMILHRGNHIGYIQSDIARIVSREISVGAVPSALVTSVVSPSEKYPYHWIEVSIILTTHNIEP